jgi:hypothetical protein
MKSAYFTIYPGKNSPPQNGCQLESVFILFLKAPVSHPQCCAVENQVLVEFHIFVVVWFSHFRLDYHRDRLWKGWASSLQGFRCG